MKTIGIIAPSAAENLGCLFIRDGLDALCRNAWPGVRIFYFDMFGDAGWEYAHLCDLILIAGNPRFAMSHDSRWEARMFQRIKRLANKGFPVVDCFCGAAHEYPATSTVKVMAARLKPHNQAVFDLHKHCCGVITRDVLAATLVNHDKHVQLPCCSWFDPDLSYQERKRDRDKTKLAAIRRMPGNEWVVKRLLTLGFDLLCINHADFVWCQRCGAPDERLILTTTKSGLVHTLSRAERVASLRIHVAIPALRLGCRVAPIKMDSRVQTIEPFCEVKPTGFTELDDRDLRYGGAKKIDPLPFRETIESMATH